MTSRLKLAIILLIVGLLVASCGDDASSTTAEATTTAAAGESSTTKVPDTAAVTTTTPGGDTSSTTTKAPPETTTTAVMTTTTPTTISTTTIVVTTPSVATTSGFVTLPTFVTVPTTPVVPAGLDTSATPNYGDQMASAGFAPDPIEYAVIGGGGVDVSYLGGGCVGFASSRPDIDFQWSGSTGTRLRFLFIPDDATSDPVMIINAPDGSWYCNDDYPPSRFPLIDFPTGPNGHYDIWVGAYAGGLLPGTLYVTELLYNPVDAKPPGA